MARRVLGLTLALLAGLAALEVQSGARLAAPWLERWATVHPGPRQPDALALQRVAEEQALDRRADVLGLLLGLTAAALGLALAPRSWAEGPGRLVRLTGLGAVVLGVLAMGHGLSEVRRLAGSERWTLGDDSLGPLLGPLADTLRAVCAAVPDDHAVLVLGTNDFLLSRVGWALFPRPVHPLLLPRPEGVSLDDLARQAAPLDLGREAPGRWLIDLDALAAGQPALARVEP